MSLRHGSGGSGGDLLGGGGGAAGLPSSNNSSIYTGSSKSRDSPFAGYDSSSSSFGGLGSHSALVRAEEIADTVFAKGKKYLPIIARTLLVSTFLEDGVRMWLQWEDQTEYFTRQWRFSAVAVGVFLSMNMLLQLIASSLIISKRHVGVAVIILTVVIFAQTLAYSVLWNLNFFLRNLALIGGLALIYADSKETKHVFSAGLAVETNSEKQKNYLVLFGRILVVFMFITLLHGDFGFLKVVFTIAGTLLITLVAIGYKTRLSALLLVSILTVSNFFLNAFWTLPLWNPFRDFMKYDFFQTLSVIGGLLLVVTLGPGSLSMDDRKKRF